MKSIFITATDTDIGKTFISVGLCLKLQSTGNKVGYFKPLQSGAYELNNKIIAPDLYELNKYLSIPSKYSYLFKGEVSPGLASIIDNIDIDINKIKKDFIEFSKPLDYTIIEGAGGLLCPISKDKLFTHLIKELNQEIIIVTTPALGKLNHTLMTIECAKYNNIKIKGIIINKVSKNPTLSEENFIKELKLHSNIKILGTIPKIENLTKEDILKAFMNFET